MYVLDKFVCVCVCVHVYAQCIYTYIHGYMDICTHVCACMPAYMCGVSVCMCVCVCMCACVSLSTRTHTHLHTHTLEIGRERERARRIVGAGSWLERQEGQRGEGGIRGEQRQTGTRT